jgi:hypothetical protein
VSGISVEPCSAELVPRENAIAIGEGLFKTKKICEFIEGSSKDNPSSRLPLGILKTHDDWLRPTCAVIEHNRSI